MNKTYLYFLPFLLLFAQSDMKQDKKKAEIPTPDLPIEKIEQVTISASPAIRKAPL